MEYIIILSELAAFAALVIFAVILNSRRLICRPNHLLNFGIWPLSALGAVTAVIFVNSGGRMCYMPHILWHALFIVLLIISFDKFSRIKLKRTGQSIFARFILFFAVFSEVLAIATNVLQFVL